MSIRQPKMEWNDGGFDQITEDENTKPINTRVQRDPTPERGPSAPYSKRAVRAYSKPMPVSTKYAAMVLVTAKFIAPCKLPGSSVL